MGAIQIIGLMYFHFVLHFYLVLSYSSTVLVDTIPGSGMIKNQQFTFLVDIFIIFSSLS